MERAAVDGGRSKVLRDRLAAWDSQLAPLSDRQREGFMELSSVAASRPLPSQLPLGEDMGQIIKTDVGALRQECSDTDELAQGLKMMENSQQLLAWFDEVEEQVQAEREKCYKVYSAQLQEYWEQCAAMLSEVSQSMASLEMMKEKHQFVSQKTGALHHACEQLMEDQTKLADMAAAIHSKLSYFTEQERLGSRLSSPAFSVTSEAFPPMLARLDDCIGFMERHPHFKESAVYLARFKLFLSRALNCVKQHVVNTLKTTTRSVTPKQGSTEVLSENSYAQYYGKFRTSAPKIKALMKEIEERTETSSEYQTLLQDCHRCYMSQRGSLLTPTSAASIEVLRTQHASDHCGLVRAGCNFLARVCQDEHQLFFHFFSVESSHLDDLLESLCYTLYDALRPVVIHINHLETLADLCTILKVEMLEEKVQPKGSELAAFGAVVKQMLEDTQQRLVFRAERYIQTDIRGYSPAAGDLAYPDKLIVASEATAEEDEGVSSDSVFESSEAESDATTPGESPRSLRRTTPGKKSRRKKRLAAVDMHAMWYPTVRRTLLCLSKLYRCIEKPVFEGVAQEVLAECVTSLQFASTALLKKKQPIDARLFLIKHLLILREQIAAFDVNFSVKEVSLDWSKTRAAAYGLLKKRSKLFSIGSNNAVLEFFLEGLPDVVEKLLDSKKEVDFKLKEICEQFIGEVSDSITQPLKGLISKYKVVFQMAEKDHLDCASLIDKQPWASADEVHKIVAEACRLIKSQVPPVKKSLVLYLANEETEHILFRPIRASILQSFEELESVVLQYYAKEDQYIISCPSQDQVSLMLALDIK